MTVRCPACAVQHEAVVVGGTTYIGCPTMPRDVFFPIDRYVEGETGTRIRK